MTKLKSEFINVLQARGYIHQCTDLAALDALAAKETITAYIGFDCTAPSLHIGNLIGIMMLRVLQQTGHQPIALMGGGTTKVGDPSGKDESRKLLSQEQIDANKTGMQADAARFLNFGSGAKDARMVDNDEWLSGLGYIDFLREYGSHFTINRMLTFDSVKLRLDREQPFTFLEFNYMLLQAYDFVELYRRHGCRLQMGGSDQWGNIINGVDLGRRVENVELFGLTTPLLTTASGAKMGKSVQGAVFLNAEMLSPYDYWQYWRNAEDGDVGRFLKLFTDMPLERDRAAGEAAGRRDQRRQDRPGDRGDRSRPRPASRRGSRRDGAAHLLRGRGRRRAADRRIARRRDQGRARRAHGFRAGGAGGVERRGEAAYSGRRRAHQRRGGEGRPGEADYRSRQRGWGDQTVARKEAACAHQTGLAGALTSQLPRNPRESEAPTLWA